MPNNYAKYIDHSLLHPTSTEKQVVDLCNEAIKWNVAAVCVKPDSVKLASELLKNTGIQIATVIGFPHGSNTTETKSFEAKNAILNGATELDIVVNISKVCDENWVYVSKEINELCTICKQNKISIKVIFETAYISKNQIVELCKICSNANVDFVKTSTGFDFIKNEMGTFTTLGAQIEDIILMKQNIANHIKIKASGGIRTSKDFLKFIELGVSRIGTSATNNILSELS
jgi:deoxyribose-phosphate aldolase